MIPAAALQHAREFAGPFQRVVDGTDYEQKGILYSEMLFMAGCLGPPAPARILESGRARGQSTHVLALMFPASEIVSIELERRMPDAGVAEARLARLPNVRLLYGDSRALLPQLLRAGDAVLIDGPKHFRAIRLALQLVGSRLPRAVFVHDLDRGTPERRFLEAHCPGVLASDDAEFVAEFARLDAKCWAAEAAQGVDWRPGGFGDGRAASYGPTLACLLPERVRAGLGPRARLELASIRQRLARRRAVPVH